MCLFSEAKLSFGEMRFCVLVLALTGQAFVFQSSWLGFLFIHSFIFRVFSVNTSFIMRRRQRKCLLRRNIKKSAAGGKQSEEREEEMLRGCESDRGWKTKECQEGWGRRPVWRLLSFAVLHVHLQLLMDRSEIREKENRRCIRLQMRSLPCTTEVKGSEGQKRATKTCVLPGSPPITKITRPPPSDLRWIPMLKAP